MALTSLAAQLKKLETPQTSLLFHKKTRPSLLFQPKKAAEFDRDTFYDLGVCGLEELKEINPRFAEFEDTLFEATSKSFERAVQTTEANKKLDVEIRTFLALLSPYFLLRSAHKALEWLINRYHVEQFNVAELLSLSLPYHETSTFAQLLGLLAISDNDPMWLWLVPVQRAAVPLSKTALLNRAATDMAFFRFVANMPDHAVKVHGKGASCLGTLFSFYCTTLLGALEYSSRVTELHVSHLLPSVMSALSSQNLPDYTASAYIILARLTTKIQLSEKLMHGFYNKISKVDNVKLRSESVLMLVLLSQNDRGCATLPERAVRRIASPPADSGGGWFVPVLVRVAENSPGLVVAPLVCTLLRTALRTVQQGSDVDHLKRFVHDLLFGDLRLEDNEESQQIFRCILEEFVENSDKSIIGWYERIVRSLETRYPMGFDKVATLVLSAGDGTDGSVGKNNRKEARAVRRLLSRSGGATRDQLFQQLIHPNPQVRAQAVKHVGKHIQPDQVSWLQEWLWERLEDNNWEVVRAMLRLPDGLMGAFARPFGANGELATRLACIVVDSWVAKWHPSPSSSSQCLRPAVAALLKHSRPTGEDDALLVLVLTPLLVDSILQKTHALILQSDVADRIEFFKTIKYLISSEDNMNDTLCEVVWKVLEDSHGTVPSSEATADALTRLSNHATEGHRFMAALLTTAAIPAHPDPEATAAIVTYVIEYVKSPKVSANENLPKLSASTLEYCLFEAVENSVPPIEAILHTLEVVATRSPPLLNQCKLATGWVSFKDKNDTLVLATLRLIIEGLSSNNPKIRMAFIQVKYLYMKNYFSDRNSLVNFLISALLLEQSIGSEYLYTLYKTLKSKGDTNKDVESLLGENSVLVPGLLLLMVSEDEKTRVLAVDCLKALTKLSRAENMFYGHLAREVVKHRGEIKLDSNQIAVVVYTRLFPSSEIQSMFLSGRGIIDMRAVLDRFISIILDQEATPLPIRFALLRLLESVNSPEIQMRMLPVVDELIGKSPKLDKLESCMLLNVLQRLNETTVSCFSETAYWEFVVRVLGDHSTRVVLPGDKKPTSPAVVLLNQISRAVFERLPNGKEDEKRLLELIIGCAVDSDSVEVSSATAALFKRLAIDSTILVELFGPMLYAGATQQKMSPKLKIKRRLSSAPPLELLETSEWKRGVCLLELIQGKKKLANIKSLLPTLFEILKKCLAFEQQAPVEYTKQLVLSAVLHCCQHADDFGADLGNCVQVDLIVQCVRASHNPQTHHHALLALTHLAHIVPDQVLHNIMAIFTFIGSSVLRQEDAYSFQIISKIVDTIIPVLIESEERNLVPKVAGIARVFVSAMLDIPEHRRLPLLKKLMLTLNGSEFLWVFLCLVFNSHITPHNQQEEKSKDAMTTGSMPRRLEMALQLVMEFNPDVILITCRKLLSHLVFMPHDKDESFDKDKYNEVKEIFNVNENSGKQLRHYKYTLISFLSSIVSAPHFVQQVAMLTETDISALRPEFGRVIEECLRYIKSVSRKAETCSSAPTARYWKAMMNQSYDVLEKTNALLPTETFLGVMGGLLTESQEPILRRKAMELLGWKLQQPGAHLSPDSLMVLLPPIVEVVETIQCNSSSDDAQPLTQEQQLYQQTALFALKLMTRHLAPDNTDTFQKIMGTVSKLVVEQSKCRSGKIGGWGVLGSLVLSLAELVSALKAHSLVYLAKFMPALIKIVDAHLEAEESNFLFLMSLVTGLCKIVECLARFLSPYLGRLLYQVSVLSARCGTDTEHHNYQSAVHKLKAIRSKLAVDIDCRVLVPPVLWAYNRLLKHSEWTGVGPLLSVLSGGYKTATDLTPELMSFFTEALDFRSSSLSDDLSPSQVDIVEAAVMECLTCVVLKLSESAFRPLYYRLYNWALQMDGGHSDRAITFYRLSSQIAESLKGLFVLFAGHFISNAARLLDENNTAKKQQANSEIDIGEAMEIDDTGDVAKSCLLIESILRTLLTVFTYDAQHFINRERFDVLMQPLVDQLENLAGGYKVASDRCDRLVTPCLAQMTVCTGDDSLWKQLNYQILLKTRHHLPHVRIASLRTVHATVRKLGEDFLPLLPETVPFLAELLEDDEETVEQECQRVVADMETVLGEPVHKYF